MLNETKGYISICLATCILGWQATLNRLLILEGIDSISLAIIKMFFAMITVLLILLIKMPKALFIEKVDIFYFIIYGVITVGVYNFFYMNSLEITNVVTTTILVYTAPIFVIIISTVFLKEKLTYTNLMAVLMTFLGCFFVAGGSDLVNLKPNVYGTLFGLGAGFCYSLWIILGKKLLDKYSPWTIVLYGNAIGIISLLFLRTPISIVKLEVSSIQLFYIYLIAFFTMVLGTFIYYYGLNYIESSKASILSNIEPIVSVIVAYFILGEVLSISKFIGFILIMISIFLTIYQGINKSINFFEDKLNDEINKNSIL